MEWELLCGRTTESPIIEINRPSNDEFVLLVRLSRSNVQMRFWGFPNDYPWQPPYWEVSDYEDKFNWKKHDPWKGAYGPHCRLTQWVDRLITMINKTKLGLKDYKTNK